MTGIKDTRKCTETEHHWINPYPYPYTDEVCAKCYMTYDAFEDTQPEMVVEVRSVQEIRPF